MGGTKLNAELNITFLVQAKSRKNYMFFGPMRGR